jgi:hypothetical protein
MAQEDGRTKDRTALHWSVHCLGISGMFGALMGITHLASQDTSHPGVALFDFAFGVLDLGVALYYASRPNE